MILKAKYQSTTITKEKEYDVVKKLSVVYVIVDDAGKLYSVPKSFVYDGSTAFEMYDEDDEEIPSCSSCNDGGCVNCDPKFFGL